MVKIKGNNKTKAIIKNPLKMYSKTPTLSDIRKSTNERIFSRNIAYTDSVDGATEKVWLQPYLNVRPLNTKYTHLPIVEPRVIHHGVSLNNYPVYNSEQIFNPGNRNAPFSGYAANINIESELKGQIYALQKCSQATYVPKSTSDLYQYSLFTSSGASGASEQNTHELLFKKEQFKKSNPNPYSNIVGVQLWSNATRVQSLDIPENYCVVAGGERREPIVPDVTPGHSSLFR